MGRRIKIGTRGSKLALWQAHWVKKAIQKNHPSFSIEIVTLKTKGDKILDVPLAMVGGKGLFIKEIEEAILSGHIDLAVHSMKDMPADIPKGLCIGAVPKRETPQDVLISKNDRLLSELNSGANIGTSSLRRAAQLRNIRPDIHISPLRGNLDTRLKKLATENLDAVILAAAGVKRLNLENRITEYLDENIMLPAVGQGALCIEIRENNPGIAQIVTDLDHPHTHMAVKGERAFLGHLEGGCQVPIAAHGKIEGNTFILSGLVADTDGRTVIKETVSGSPSQSETVGIELAERLMSKGAKIILERIYSSFAPP